MVICAAFVLHCASLWFICNILFVSEGCEYMFRSEHHLYKSLIYLYKPYNNFTMIYKYIFICLYRLRFRLTCTGPWLICTYSCLYGYIDIYKSCVLFLFLFTWLFLLLCTFSPSYVCSYPIHNLSHDCFFLGEVGFLLL